MRILAEAINGFFTIWRIAPFYAKPDQDPYADGTRRFLVLRLKPINDQQSFHISLTKEERALPYNRAQTQIEEAIGRLWKAQFTAEKMQQLTHLLENLLLWAIPDKEAIPGDNE